MNRAAVELGRPMVDAAMYDLEARLTTIIPGKTACLACLYPQRPPAWKRQFPVFGAVSATVGAMAALEVIKVLSGVAAPLAGRMLVCDLRAMTFRALPVTRREGCAVCGGVSPRMHPHGHQ